MADERGIVDASFSRCLKIAWRKAKATAVAAVQKAKLGTMMGTPKGERIRALTSALEQTQNLLFRYSAAAERSAIEREISSLIEENAQ